MLFKYFFLFSRLLIQLFNIYLKYYFKLEITDKNINTTINLIKCNGALCIKIIQWLISRNEINEYQLINHFSKFSCFLENCKIHSFEYTLSLLKNDQVIVFNSIHPIASGSIAQVYDCTYKGKRVALKVKHPEIDEQIYFPKIFIKLVVFFMNICNIHIPIEINDFFKIFYNQLNFNLEVENLISFKHNFKNNSLIVIPEYMYHTDGYIIMSYEDGSCIENIYKDNNVTSMTRYKIIFTLYAFILQCYLIDGIIHCDLHSGNWKVKIKDNDYKLVIYDFGVVTRITNVGIMQEISYLFMTNCLFYDKDKFFNLFINNEFIKNGDIDKNKICDLLLNSEVGKILKRPMNISLYFLEMCKIFKKDNIHFQTNFLLIILGISLIEKHLIEYSHYGENRIYTNFEPENKISNMDILFYNETMEKINFFNTIDNFHELSRLFSNLLQRYKTEKGIKSFLDIKKENNKIIKFLPI